MTKYVTMVVFCHIRLGLIFDSLTDTMIKLLKKLKSSAEKHVDNYILQEVKRVDGKFDILGKLAVLNVENPKSVIEDKIYPTVSKAKLKEIIVDLQHRGNKWYQGQVREKMYSTYTYGSRRSLLAIIRTLQIFEENIDYKPIIDAIGFINKYWDESDSPYYINIPPLNGVIPKGWRHIVVSVTKDKLCIHKYNYELAVFEQLKKLLGFKAIWVNVKRTAALAVSTFALLAELVLMGYFFPKTETDQYNGDGNKAVVVTASFLLPSADFALRIAAVKYFNESLKCNIKKDVIASVLREDKFLIHCAQTQSGQDQESRKVHSVVIGQKVDDFVDNFTPILSQFGNIIEIIGCGTFIARKTGLFPTLLLSGFTGGTLIVVHYITQGINDHSENERHLRDSVVERFAFIGNNASAINIALTILNNIRGLSNTTSKYKAISSSLDQLEALEAEITKFSESIKRKLLFIKYNVETKGRDVTLEDLTVSVPKSESQTRLIVDQFTGTFEQSKIYKITGPSGSGKTTFLNALVDCVVHSSGKIMYPFDKKDIVYIS